MKLKVTHEFGIEVGYEAYIVDFVQEAGCTYAIIVLEDGSISKNNIEDVTIDFRSL